MRVPVYSSKKEDWRRIYVETKISWVDHPIALTWPYGSIARASYLNLRMMASKAIISDYLL